MRSCTRLQLGGAGQPVQGALDQTHLFCQIYLPAISALHDTCARRMGQGYDSKWETLTGDSSEKEGTEHSCPGAWTPGLACLPAPPARVAVDVPLLSWHFIHQTPQLPMA